MNMKKKRADFFMDCLNQFGNKYMRKNRFKKAAIGTLTAVLIGLGILGVNIKNNTISIKTFNELRNRLAAKCVNDEVFTPEEYSTFVDVMDREIKSRKNKNVILTNVSGDPFKALCRSMIK